MGRATGSFVASAAFLGLFALRAWPVAPDVALVQGLLCVVMLLGAFAVRAGRTGAWVALGAAAVTILGGAAVWVLTGTYVPGTIVALFAGMAAFGAGTGPAGPSTGTVPAAGAVAVSGGPHPLPGAVGVGAAAAPQFATAATRPTLSSLRTTSASSLQAAGATGPTPTAQDDPARTRTPSAAPVVRSFAPADAAPSPVLPGGSDRVWGSPAAPGSAAQVLPGGRRGRRRRGRGAALPVPQAVGVPALQRPALVPPRSVEPPAAPPGPAPVPAQAAGPEATEPLTRRPGDPQVGTALLAPARARLGELAAPLLTSWLAALAAGERAEPVTALSPGQIAVLAAACEDAAISARLLDAVTDAPAHAARAARAARAAALLHTVARSTSGTDAQAAVLRTLDAVHTS